MAAHAQEDAKAHYQKATAHFAVGEYHEAAVEYEEAFKLKQDPAILFNAAQSFRLAGDNQKALLLYNNIIKLYPGTQFAKDSRERIEKLAQSGT
ncbi:MAG TPA: tetratricopeptide repeat protein, partial [Polyangia bacterium]|nr:tetratricopeptide repeat protein [Polyangia bacterium]